MRVAIAPPSVPVGRIKSFPFGPEYESRPSAAPVGQR
jgi:hypothetical protein